MDSARSGSEMRLVDADALKADYGMKDDCADCEKELQGTVRSCEYDHIYSKMDFCGWIDDAPTIDAVEVVRCKDCKHWYSDADTGMACEFTNMGQPKDGFCNWAAVCADSGTTYQALCPRDHELITDVGNLDAITQAVRQALKK